MKNKCSSGLSDRECRHRGSRMELRSARRPLESPGLPAHRTGLLRGALLCGALLLLEPTRDAVLVEHMRTGACCHRTCIACEMTWKYICF